MKAGLLLLCLGLALANADYQTVCPDELQEFAPCSCIKSLGYVVCDQDLTTKKLELKHDYSLTSLVIRTTKGLANIFEHVTNKVKVENLIIYDDSEAEVLTGTDEEQKKKQAQKVLDDEALANDISVLFSVASKSIKLVTKQRRTISFASAGENGDLESLSFTNVELLNFPQLNSFQKLKQIEFHHVEFESKNFEVNLNTLHRIVITNARKFTGFTTVQAPAECKAGDLIYIDLSGSGITDFNLAALDFADPHCKYHIDLSYTKVSADFLEQYRIKKVFKNVAPPKLYFVMQGVQQTCNQCIFDEFIAKNKGFVHSIQCKDLNLYLTDYTEKNQELTNKLKDTKCTAVA